MPSLALAAKPYFEVGTLLRSGYRRAGGNGATGGVVTLGTGAGVFGIYNSELVEGELQDSVTPSELE